MTAQEKVIEFPGAAQQPQPDQTPHNLEVEMGFLGALLLRSELYHQVAEFLAPEHFHEALHARLYEKSADLIANGGKADLLLLKTFFAGDATFVEIGGVAYLAKIMAGAPVPSTAVIYAHHIVELAERRRTLAVLEEAREQVLDPRTPGGTVVADAVDKLVNGAGIASGHLTPHMFELNGAVQTVITRVNDVLVHGVVIEESAWPGSSALAGVIGGWRRKRLYIIGGRPGMGKTTVALSWLLRTATRGHGVLYISLEMEAGELSERALADLSWRPDRPIHYDRIGRNKIEPEEMGRIVRAAETIENAPFRIEERPNLGLAQIGAVARAVANDFRRAGRRLEVVCVDHLGLVKASERYAGQRTAEIEELTAGLKTLAKELDVAVIALSQLNRQVENREDKRPQLADLRQSGSIEQDADVILFTYREQYYAQRSQGTTDERADAVADASPELEIIVAKNRAGNCLTLKFHVDVASNAVRDLNMVNHQRNSFDF